MWHLDDNCQYQGHTHQCLEKSLVKQSNGQACLSLTHTYGSITSESSDASAGEATNGVGAVGIVHITVVHTHSTFINIYQVDVVER